MEARPANFYGSVERSGRSGMTLIELLVSLAIIVLMVGITFPIFSYYQKRSTVESDINNFVSLFNYARALQNNPDSFSRSSSDNYSFIIKLTNNSSTHRAELFSSADPTTVIDTANFSENIAVNTDTNKSDGLTLSFSGKSPNEIISCSIDCSSKILFGFSTTGSGSFTRTATILNSTSTQLLSINIK